MKYFDHFFQPQGWQEKTFAAHDGATIRYGHVAPKGPFRGTVIMTTGYADYIESFYDTVQDYADRGYDVWIMDWAGQGGSSKRGPGLSAPSTKAFSVNDHILHLKQFRDDIVKPTAAAPVILSTHSLGGLVALNYLHVYPQDFHSAILAAPLVDFGLSPFVKTVLRGIFRSAVNMGWRDSALGGGRSGIQRQANNVRKKPRADEPVRIDLHRTFFLLAKPLGAEDPSVALIDSLLESTTRLNEEVLLKSLTTPILIGVAGTDHIVNNAAIRRAAGLIPGAKLIELPTSGHSVWQEGPHISTPWWAGVDSFLADTHHRHAQKPAAPKPPAGPR